MSGPRYVALCGAPGAGKSTVAERLAYHFGGVIVDDGLPLRQAAMKLYGLSWEDVSTQEGKAREVMVCGEIFTVRQLLGDLGNMLEAFYGDQFMPERALALTKLRPDAPFYIFPSCRKNQGLTYRREGGFVVEVARPGHQPVNDFDHYDRSLVNMCIFNNYGLQDLEDQVMFDFGRWFPSQPWCEESIQYISGDCAP